MERLIFKETYNLLTKYLDMPESEDKWMNLTQDAKEIRNRYPVDLCKDMLQGVLKHIEYKSKERATT